MSYEEILKVSDNGKFRVKLIQDEMASEPYDDGQSPLIRLEYTGYRYRAEHIQHGSRPTGNDERIEEAAQRWGTPSDDNFERCFEKYLRAYYGTREIETWYSGSYWYVTYDTAEWREYIGWTAENADRMPDHLINMDEYRAWCEGECYGYVVEKNVTWQNVDDANDQMETWEEVFDYSCWGYYGDTEYFRNSALEALESAAAS